MKAYRGLLVAAALAVFLAGCADQPFTVDVPIRVVAIHPAGSGVPRDIQIEVTFSEDVVESTVTDGANFFLEDITDADNPVLVEGTITYDASDVFKATFQPSDLLVYSTEYRVTLTTGVLRLRDDGAMPVRVTGTFRTLDPPPLRLVGSNPGPDSIGVPLESDMVLTFSEPVDCASVEAGIAVVEIFDPHPHTGPGQRDVAGTWSCSEPDSINVDTCDGNDHCVVTFTPTEPYEYSSEVTVTLTGGTREDGAVESHRATDFGGQLPEDVVMTFHVEDPPPFYVSETLPGAGTNGVARASQILISFSEPVECATLPDNLLIEETLDAHPRLGAEAGTTRQVTGTLTCNPAPEGDYLCGDGGIDDPCVATFVPDASFEWSSTITVTLHGAPYTPGQAPAARTTESTRATSYGGNLTDDVIYSFRIKDPAPLLVSAVNPGPGAEMVDRNTMFAFTFSAALNCPTVNDVTVVVTETLDPVLGGGTSTLAGTLTCTQGDLTVTFDPGTILNYSSLIDVVLKGGLFDAASYPDHAIESAVATSRGGQLPADFAYGFIALDPPPLYVIGTSPAAGSIRVATDADIEITFSESLDCSTITAAAFTVNEQTDAGGSIAHTGTITCNAGDPVVVFDPILEFQLTSQVTVALDAGIRSARGTSRGGTLGSDFVFTFSTADPPPLLVVSTSPGGSQDNVSAYTDIVVTFSDEVDRSSLDPSTFVVEDISDPMNPVPVECGVPDGTYEFSSGDAVVACDPPGSFEYDATIRVTLTTGIHSVIATSGGGRLPFDVVWAFDVIPVPPVEVVEIVPHDGSQNAPVSTNVSVIFNQDVLESTIVTYQDQRPCGADGDCPGAIACGNDNPGFCDLDPANITAWLNPGAGSDITSRVAIDLVSYDAGTYMAVFGPVVDLTAGMQYTFTIRGGLSGVRGRFGASILVADFISHFATGLNVLLGTTIPRDGDAGVAVSTEVCAIFLEDIDPATITTGTFVLTFDDEFGTHLVPASGFTYEGVDPGTLEPDGTGTYNNNKVCLVIAEEFWDCHPDARPLLYNTTYQATLADSICNTDGSQCLDGGYAWTFSTGGPPQVLGAYGENAVVTVDPLDGGIDVPVNCAFHVVFATELDPSTVDGVRLQILDTTGTPVAASVSTSPDLLEAVITPDAILDYAAAYTLRLSGGYGGVLLADGSYLDADFLASFITSPPTYAYISPPQGEDLYMTAMIPIVFSRAMHFPSLTEQNIYSIDNTDGLTMQGVVATNSGDLDSCILSPVPTFLKDHDIDIVVSTGVQDFRGNPLASEALANFPIVGEVSAGTSRTPDTLFASNVAPANGAQVAGDQEFVLTLMVGAHIRDRMLPATFNRYTMEFLGTGGAAGCTVEMFGSTNVYNIGPAFQPDSVIIRANLLLRSGCGYRLTLHQDQFANIYGLANEDPPIVMDYVGEDVPPQLLPADIHVDSIGGADVPADGLSDVWPRTSVWATFNENMDPASFSAATYTLVCGGNPVAGTISAEGTLAIFKPLVPLSGADSCTATITGAVTDLAGNPMGSTVAANFTVESDAPTVVATNPANAQADVLVSTGVSITFSEEVDPATLLGSTVAATGTVRLVEQATLAEVYGCIWPGPVPEEVIFSPFRDLQPATTYDITVTTGVADFGGTPVPADFTASFTTQ